MRRNFWILTIAESDYCKKDNVTSSWNSSRLVLLQKTANRKYREWRNLTTLDLYTKSYCFHFSSFFFFYLFLCSIIFFVDSFFINFSTGKMNFVEERCLLFQKRTRLRDFLDLILAHSWVECISSCKPFSCFFFVKSIRILTDSTLQIPLELVLSVRVCADTKVERLFLKFDLTTAFNQVECGWS